MKPPGFVQAPASGAQEQLPRPAAAGFKVTMATQLRSPLGASQPPQRGRGQPDPEKGRGGENRETGPKGSPRQRGPQTKAWGGGPSESTHWTGLRAEFIPQGGDEVGAEVWGPRVVLWGTSF